MLPNSKLFRSGMAATLLLAGAVAVARGQVADFGSFGVSSGAMTITGNVVCTQCSLDDARKAHPYENHFYQLSHRRGRLVMKVTAIDKAAAFESVAWPPLLWVRGEDSLLDRLGAEENLFKEITVTGRLHTSRTLDVLDVSIKG
jgi:hypothetical protein